MEHEALPNRSTLSVSDRSEQGYTLQVLIITAIAALLAVAAGVVIIAITRNAQDNLSSSDSDLDSKCKPWEIHNVELAAAGAGGGKEIFYHASWTAELIPFPGVGGVTSSAIGCLPSCYLTLTYGSDTTLDAVIERFNDDPQYDRAPRKGDLKFDISNRPPEYGADPRGGGAVMAEVRLGVVHLLPFFADKTWYRVDTVTGDDSPIFGSLIDATATGSIFSINRLAGSNSRREIIRNQGPTSTPVAVGLQDPPVLKGSNLGVRALAYPGVCDIYDQVTGEVFMSSQESRVGLFIP